MEKWLVQGTYKMSGAWGNIQVSVSEHGGSQREHGNCSPFRIGCGRRAAKGGPPGDVQGCWLQGLISWGGVSIIATDLDFMSI